MRYLKRTSSFVVAAVVAALCLSLFGQYSADFRLGGKTLYSLQAPTLREDTPISQAVHSPVYLASVGGVAFDAVAKPAAGQSVGRVQLSYDHNAEDGSRMTLTVGGQAVAVALYDWELVPIARFASSPYHAAFTLFGRVSDAKKQADVDMSFDQSTRAMNYHPALANTLLGLRIFQLDELILSEDSVQLPTLGGEYILGPGESSPTPRSGYEALARLHQGLTRIIDETGANFQSYLICDYEQNVEFSVVDGRLLVTGTPYYYFWKHQGRKVVFLKQLSDWTSGQTDLLENINPAVWDAGVKLMQYSAVFRYVKKNNPVAWQHFLTAVAKIRPEPQVKTPTFMIEPQR
jgi:hypothetical protein